MPASTRVITPVGSAARLRYGLNVNPRGHGCAAAGDLRPILFGNRSASGATGELPLFAGEPHNGTRPTLPGIPAMIATDMICEDHWGPPVGPPILAGVLRFLTFTLFSPARLWMFSGRGWYTDLLATTGLRDHSAARGTQQGIL
eukprot:SAG31_NODE_2255_length_6073_cov_2.134248_7_plen_144_part_00